MSNLAKACEMSRNDWLATFPETIPEAECSEKHEKWKKNLFNKMRDDRYHRFTTRTVKIMVVAAIITAIMLTAFVFPSSRKHILDELDVFSSYKITENNKNSVSREITVGYIPEGFELKEITHLYKQVIYEYENNNGVFFTVLKCSSSMKVDFNTEHNAYEKITYNDIEYVYCKGNIGIDNLIWIKHDYVYRIDGNVSLDEFIKIAENII